MLTVGSVTPTFYSLELLALYFIVTVRPSIFKKLNLIEEESMALRKSLRFEQLENKKMMAIVWANEFGPAPDDNVIPNFGIYGANEGLARAIVHRAIDDWNKVITSFNYTEDADSNPDNDLNDTFELIIAGLEHIPTIRGEAIPDFEEPRLDGKYSRAYIKMDDNGGGDGWFFDTTPEDDVEFSSLASPFLSTFVDVDGQTTRLNDFYRTITHEIGHALGINSQQLASMLTLNGHEDEVQRAAGVSNPTDLRTFASTRPNPQFGVQATFTGAHLYEGHVNDAPGLLAHPNELMNAGRTSPAGTNPSETGRAFITDLDVKILADAYGYDVVLPSTINNAHVMLDSLTGTLLVQGAARNNTTGAGVNDTISLERVIDGQGDNILVTVNGLTERVPFSRITEIVIHRNGGTDSVTVNSNVTQPVREVDFVVSSNQDALETSTSVGGSTTNNGIVDLSTAIPGSQTTLRAAIIEANAAGAARSIYVGRNTYNLTLTGSGGATEGDLDLTGDVTIIGAGAGLSIIKATELNDRLFDLSGASARLTLDGLTLTGGTNAEVAGGIRVMGGASLEITDSALVNLETGLTGGAIFFHGQASVTSGLTVRRSVFTNDRAMTGPGGAISFVGGTGHTLTVGESVFALNLGHANGQVQFTSIYTQGSNLTKVNEGYNLTDDNASGFFSTIVGDHIGTTNYVVTSLADTYTHTDDDHALSLREAIDLANTNDNTLETIWLPAWNIVLTRERQGGVGTTDTSVEWGDLDISDSLAIRGVSAGLTSVRWRPGVTDAVFDLLGDYNGNGIAGGTVDSGSVNGSDFLIWQQQFNSSGALNQFSADGDDDGDVDGDDLTIWQDHYANTLGLANLTTVLA